MKHLFLLLLGVCTFFNSQSQTAVTFTISNLPEGHLKNIGIRGSQFPMSWDITTKLEYNEVRQQYEGTLIFGKDVKSFEYKFVYENGGQLTWEKLNNRFEYLADEPAYHFEHKWNQVRRLDLTKLTPLTVTELSQDFEILKEAIFKVHPGLYRHADTLEIKDQFEKLKRTFSTSRTRGEAYLAISRLLASIRCDHTFASYYNQGPILKEILEYQANKVPFTFSWIDGRMIVGLDASEAGSLTKGTEILSINSVPASEILEAVKMHISADGNTSGNIIRKSEIHPFGLEIYPFDILYPLLYPTHAPMLALEVMPYQSETISTVNVRTVTSQERNKVMSERYHDEFLTDLSALWSFEILDGNVGYLQTGTFIIDGIEKHVRKIINGAFSAFKKANIQSLIIDQRANVGGFDEPGRILGRYLSKSVADYGGFEGRSRYLTFPESLKPHVRSWEDWYYQLGKNGDYFDRDGYHVFPNEFKSKPVKPVKGAFGGDLYVLTSGFNTSAAFYSARFLKQAGKATLIGQETGGNLQGINGGTILFLILPNSRIEIDLPIIGSFATTAMPDSGIKPDIYVPRSVDDFVNGRDAALEAALAAIKKQ